MSVEAFLFLHHLVHYLLCRHHNYCRRGWGGGREQRERDRKEEKLNSVYVMYVVHGMLDKLHTFPADESCKLETALSTYGPTRCFFLICTCMSLHPMLLALAKKWLMLEAQDLLYLCAGGCAGSLTHLFSFSRLLLPKISYCSAA